MEEKQPAICSDEETVVEEVRRYRKAKEYERERERRETDLRKFFVGKRWPWQGIAS